MNTRWVGNLLAFLGAVIVAFASPLVLGGTAQIAKVEWGFSGNIASGRWAPVRVWINSGDKPEQGMITIEYQQDATQKARIIAPVSVMPGTPTAVDILVNLPAEPDPITVTYSSDRVNGDAIEFSPNPGQNQKLGPEIYGGTRQLVLCIGTDAPLAALSEPTSVKRRPTFGQDELWSHQGLRGEDLRELRWHQTAGVSLQAGELPTDPHAFDGVAALVVDAEKAGLPSPALKSAISTWVAAGGRLVLLVDRDGDAWRSWMPDAEGMPVSLGAARELPSPQELRKAIESGETASLSAPGPIQHVDGRGIGNSQFRRTMRAFAASVRASIRGRPITIETDAAARGWVGRLPMSKSEFLSADGPVGLGMVTIIGANPSTVSSDLKPEALKAAWRVALTRVLDRYLDRPLSLQAMGQDALADVMDKFAGVPEIGRGMLYMTVSGLFLFALILGVGDYFLLGKLQMRQRSWLTAIGWIAIFSLAAGFIIPRMRAGRTEVNRAVCIDIIQTGNSPTANAQAWVTGVSGVFAGSLTTVEQSKTAAPGLLRGASAERDTSMFPWQQRTTRVGLLPVETIQAAMPGGERANILAGGLSQASWTYRIVADDSKPQTKIRVEIESADTAIAQVKVYGLAQGVNLTDAALELGGRVYSNGRGVADADGVVSIKLIAKNGAELRLAPLLGSVGAAYGGFGSQTTSPAIARVGPEATPGLLDAAVDRETALRARAAGGQAVFIADLTADAIGVNDAGLGEWMLNVRSDKSAAMKVSATIRVAVPMAEKAR